MKSGKRALDKLPAVVNAYAYGSEWVKWWTAAQPQERDSQQWPFSRDSIGGADWRKFPANGKDGIFLAVMALSWWATAVRSINEIAFYEEAVTDLHWVIEELIRIKSASQPPPPPSQGDLNSHQPEPTPRQPKPTTHRPAPTPRRPAPTPCQPDPTPRQPDPTPRQPDPTPSQTDPMPSPPASSSRPPLSTSGGHTHQRAEGKRVVIPTWKVLANQ